MTILVPLPIPVCVFFSNFPIWYFCCSLLEPGLWVRSRFFEVSRPLRSPTCYACMVRLWNDLNIWSCVQLVVSIVVISMQLWKPMIWCPGGAKNKEVLRFAVELLGHIFPKTFWYTVDILMMSFFEDPNSVFKNDFGVTLWETLQYPHNFPKEVLHSRDADLVQCWYASSSNVILLLAEDAGR